MIDNDDIRPSIAFKPLWQHTVVVKLLGQYIGYKALCNRLESLCRSTLGFSIIDLENDYFLVHFKLERDTEFALT